MNFIKIGNTEYDLAPITFSEESIELLEIVESIAEKEKDIKPSKIIKAIRLQYKVILDCMVRGGTEENEAKKALAGVEINMETIKNFMQAMIKLNEA